jgi:hypothetical protein
MFLKSKTIFRNVEIIGRQPRVVSYTVITGSNAQLTIVDACS